MPPTIAMMMQDSELLTHTKLSSVRYVRMGSAPVSGALLQRTHALLPNAKVATRMALPRVARSCSGSIRRACPRLCMRSARGVRKWNFVSSIRTANLRTKAGWRCAARA
ncbi:hypothetical protein [Caballeronia sp. KNU42]